MLFRSGRLTEGLSEPPGPLRHGTDLGTVEGEATSRKGGGGAPQGRPDGGGGGPLRLYRCQLLCPLVSPADRDFPETVAKKVILLEFLSVNH